MTDDLSPGVWPIVRSRGDGFTPTGAHDAYKKGDRVFYDGRAWTSKIDANVWSPKDYPAGWE